MFTYNQWMLWPTISHFFFRKEQLTNIYNRTIQRFSVLLISLSMSAYKDYYVGIWNIYLEEQYFELLVILYVPCVDSGY